MNLTLSSFPVVPTARPPLPQVSVLAISVAAVLFLAPGRLRRPLLFRRRGCRVAVAMARLPDRPAQSCAISRSSRQSANPANLGPQTLRGRSRQAGEERQASAPTKVPTLGRSICALVKRPRHWKYCNRPSGASRQLQLERQPRYGLATQRRSRSGGGVSATVGAPRSRQIQKGGGIASQIGASKRARAARCGKARRPLRRPLHRPARSTRSSEKPYPPTPRPWCNNWRSGCRRTAGFCGRWANWPP